MDSVQWYCGIVVVHWLGGLGRLSRLIAARPAYLNQQLALIAECFQVLNGSHVLQDKHVSALGQHVESLNRPCVTCDKMASWG